LLLSFAFDSIDIFSALYYVHSDIWNRWWIRNLCKGYNGLCYVECTSTSLQQHDLHVGTISWMKSIFVSMNMDNYILIYLWKLNVVSCCSFLCFLLSVFMALVRMIGLYVIPINRVTDFRKLSLCPPLLAPGMNLNLWLNLQI